MATRRPQAHTRSSSHGSTSATGFTLSRSAPVSPSVSFASLAALRNSIAMRSGDLGLEESAHTFPVDDEERAPRIQSQAGPSTARQLDQNNHQQRLMAIQSQAGPSTARQLDQNSHQQQLMAIQSQAGPSTARQLDQNNHQQRLMAIQSQAGPSTARQLDQNSHQQQLMANRISAHQPLQTFSTTTRSALPQRSPDSGPIPPPLSMQNLPPPRTALSAHNDRRISPFHERRGMSFTPAASPPLAISPTAPIGYFDTESTTSHTPRRTPSGIISSQTRSAGPSRSSSPTGSVYRDSTRSDTSRRTQHYRRPRSRATSDAAIGTASMSRRSSRQQAAAGDIGTGNSLPSAAAAAAAAPTTSVSHAPKYHRQMSYGAGSSASFRESDASDTGAEADADDLLPRPPIRVRPTRTRSNSHLSSSGTSGELSSSLRNRMDGGATAPRRSGFATTGGGSSPWGSWYNRDPVSVFTAWRAPDREAAHLHDLSASGVVDLDTAADQLWQLHQAAMQSSPGAGLGVDLLTGHSRRSSMGEAMVPPPPYQANDDVDHAQLARNLVNQLELEQAEASVGRRLSHSRPGSPRGWEVSGAERGDEHEGTGREGLSFRSASHRRREDGHTRQRSSTASTAPTTRSDHSLSQRSSQHYEPTQSEISMTERPHSPQDGGSPPAWQPKSDTEGDTDTNEVDRYEAREETGATLSSPNETNRSSIYLPTPPQRSSSGSRRNLDGHLAASPQTQRLTEEDDYFGPSPWVLRYLLHPLRLLAALPGSVGTFWLIRNAVVHLQTSGSLFERGPLDVSQPHISNPWRMTRALDFFLASLWAVSTAYHALSLTTLLLRRWLIYYSLFPSLIRLLALQAICWPLVRMTIFVAGPDRPIEAWIVIASTTAFSDVVARWVTSNIADAPTKRLTVQGRSVKSYSISGRRLSGPRRSRAITPPTGMVSSYGRGECARNALESRRAEEGERPPTSLSHSSSSRHLPSRPTPEGRIRTGQRFWRAVMGAPMDSSTSDSDESAKNYGDGEAYEGEDGDTRLLIASALADGGRGSTIRSSHLSSRRARREAVSSRPIVAVNCSSPHYHLGNLASSIDTNLELEGETTDAGATTDPLALSHDDDDDDDDDDDINENEDEAGGESQEGGGEGEGRATAEEEALYRLRVAQRKRRRLRMKMRIAALHGDPTRPSSSSQDGLLEAISTFWSRRATDSTSAAGHGSHRDGGGGSETFPRGVGVGVGVGIGIGVKVRSRRVFHWEVAMKRNVAPIGILAYLTLWGMLIGSR